MMQKNIFSIKFFLSLILIILIPVACSFDPDTSIFDTDDDDDDNDDDSSNASKSTFGGSCKINSDCADPFQCIGGICSYSTDYDDDDSPDYGTYDELCETYEICTPARGTYLCMVTKDNVSPNIPRCDMDGEGCSKGQVPMMVFFGEEPECGCVTICGKGSGEYGDSECDAEETCTILGTIYICMEGEEMPSDTNLCNVETAEGCDSDEIPMVTEYDGNPICVCLQGC